MKQFICVLLIIILNLIPIGSGSFAESFQLSPGDTLEIKIIGQKDLDTKQAIAPDGTISLPAVGRIKAQGLTLKQLDDYLNIEFSKYIEKPNIVVYLTEKPDFWEKNWYKVITATAVLVGIYATVHR